MLEVRDAVLTDVDDIAFIHTRSWQETYRGIVPDERLDDPRNLERRKTWWTSVISGEDARTTRAAVALIDGRTVGFCGTGPSKNEDLPGIEQLDVIYSLAAWHGQGAGAALVQHLLADRPALVWVEERNPRARAFYRKMGFIEDGTTLIEGPFREVRMVR